MRRRKKAYLPKVANAILLRGRQIRVATVTVKNPPPGKLAESLGRCQRVTTDLWSDGVKQGWLKGMLALAQGPWSPERGDWNVHAHLLLATDGGTEVAFQAAKECVKERTDVEANAYIDSPLSGSPMSVIQHVDRYIGYISMDARGKEDSIPEIGALLGISEQNFPEYVQAVDGRRMLRSHGELRGGLDDKWEQQFWFEYDEYRSASHVVEEDDVFVNQPGNVDLGKLVEGISFDVDDGGGRFSTTGKSDSWRDHFHHFFDLFERRER